MSTASKPAIQDRRGKNRMSDAVGQSNARLGRVGVSAMMGRGSGTSANGEPWNIAVSIREPRPHQRPSRRLAHSPTHALARLLGALDTRNSAFAPYRLMAAARVLRSGLLRCYEKHKKSSGTESVPSFGQTPMAALSVDSFTNSTRRGHK